MISISFFQSPNAEPRTRNVLFLIPFELSALSPFFLSLKLILSVERLKAVLNLHNLLKNRGGSGVMPTIEAISEVFMTAFRALPKRVRGGSKQKWSAIGICDHLMTCPFHRRRKIADKIMTKNCPSGGQEQEQLLPGQCSELTRKGLSKRNSSNYKGMESNKPEAKRVFTEAEIERIVLEGR